jgi:hypothetical protein
MFTCERCGTRFARRGAAGESCPRCLVRDGIRTTLSRAPGAGDADEPLPTVRLERAVRKELGRRAR